MNEMYNGVCNALWFVFSGFNTAICFNRFTYLLTYLLLYRSMLGKYYMNVFKRIIKLLYHALPSMHWAFLPYSTHLEIVLYREAI
jgi:hypothetical protein